MMVKNILLIVTLLSFLCLSATSYANVEPKAVDPKMPETSQRAHSQINDQVKHLNDLVEIPICLVCLAEPEPEPEPFEYGLPPIQIVPRERFEYGLPPIQIVPKEGMNPYDPCTQIYPSPCKPTEETGDGNLFSGYTVSQFQEISKEGAKEAQKIFGARPKGMEIRLRPFTASANPVLTVYYKTLPTPNQKGEILGYKIVWSFLGSDGPVIGSTTWYDANGKVIEIGSKDNKNPKDGKIKLSGSKNDEATNMLLLNHERILRNQDQHKPIPRGKRLKK